MLKSMTAYGRAVATTFWGRIVVEINSVNRKYLEFNLFLPKEFIRFDSSLRQWIGALVHRGQINVKVSASFDKESPTTVAPNLPLARQLKQAWDQIAADLQIKGDIPLQLLANESGILLFEENLKDEESVKQVLHEATDQALQQFMLMKKREGEALSKDIAARLEKLVVWIKQIEAKAPEAPKKFRQKLLERLEEVLHKSVENEERLLREVCVYAEKIDISEEITRFNSHLDQLSALLRKESSGVGKTMDFIVQELNREINTIGSKSSDIEVSHLVVEVKGELERIREQIQNIE